MIFKYTDHFYNNLNYSIIFKKVGLFSLLNVRHLLIISSILFGILDFNSSSNHEVFYFNFIIIYSSVYRCHGS